MKALMFVACEKVIVDNQGTASLIVIMQGVSIAHPRESPIPSGAVGPKEWALATMWQPDPGQKGKVLDQLYEIFLPDGTSFAKPRIQFPISDDESNAMVFLHMNAMPLGQQGNLKINAWVEDDGRIVSEVAEYLIKIVHGGPLPANLVQAVVQ